MNLDFKWQRTGPMSISLTGPQRAYAAARLLIHRGAYSLSEQTSACALVVTGTSERIDRAVEFFLDHHPSAHW